MNTKGHIEETAKLYEVYVSGWDAALRRAAFFLGPRERDVVLSFVKSPLVALTADAEELGLYQESK